MLYLRDFENEICDDNKYNDGLFSQEGRIVSITAMRWRGLGGGGGGRGL